MPKHRSHADRSLRSDSCLSQVMLGSFFSIVLLLGTACQAKFKKNSYPTAKTSNAESAEALGDGLMKIGSKSLLVSMIASSPKKQKIHTLNSSRRLANSLITSKPLRIGG
ncbi:MAG: hypothetical protein NTX25_16350 [Proteobacteria bacterium]|nr:hypothetical protein [Pseudomonadota bacterium]